MSVSHTTYGPARDMARIFRTRGSNCLPKVVAGCLVGSLRLPSFAEVLHELDAILVLQRSLPLHTKLCTHLMYVIQQWIAGESMESKKQTLLLLLPLICSLFWRCRRCSR
eukprot:TRINITY_DN82058_c0_g1_i1.p2 TRINITY_DN82058_c0_g1~~TRINITY_DN82058_c0_g1_i1.p2  ORF type:complete len:110 (-),score=9.94 TRINITY_DN82058_c0_g1_i1:231-560(-)